MHEIVRQFRDFFVSLRLTVVLLVLSIVLILAATFDQVNLGVWAVQEKYFRSLFVLWTVGDGIPIPVFPGGYLIGGLLFINLISAHVYRFKLGWRKAGIFLTHAGLILLLLGEFFTGLWQEDFQMRLEEGESKNYSESFLYNELAIIDYTDETTDEVVVIPEKVLGRGEAIQHPKLPFRVVPRLHYPNAMLQMRASVANPPPAPPTVDLGTRIVAQPMPYTYKPDERNFPAAFVELVGAEGSLGTWLVSTELPVPQHFEYAGRKWKLLMRFERSYKPFTLTLKEVRHDKYPGTEIPKNFSSLVHVSSTGASDDRDVLIFMNNPLRYEGFTFYQYQMDAPSKLSVLQVVKNPSWLIPYIACSLMGFGLLWQFGHHLLGFAARRKKVAA